MVTLAWWRRDNYTILCFLLRSSRMTSFRWLRRLGWRYVSAFDDRRLAQSQRATVRSLDLSSHLAFVCVCQVSARRAARLYARERAILPVGTGSQLYDGCRNWLQYGSFQPDGLNEEQIFSKYADRLKIDPPKWSDVDVDDEVYTELYRMVLEKSCTTNPRADAITSIVHSLSTRTSGFNSNALDAFSRVAHLITQPWHELMDRMTL